MTWKYNKGYLISSANDRDHLFFSLKAIMQSNGLIWAIAITILTSVSATSKSTSLDEPFQSSFKNLPHSPCVTLYYRNGRIGCGTTDRDVQTAPLFYYDGSSKPESGVDFVAVIEEFAMKSSVISTLLADNANGELKGILVLNSTDSENGNDYASPGPQYPMGYGDPSAALSYGNIQFPWNGNGDGLILKDLYGVPMVYVNEWEASNYIREASQDATKAAKINAEFNYYMGPDGIKSADCLSWKDAADDKWNPKCLPLGGTSIWAHAGSPPPKGGSSSSSSKQAIIIGTSIDTTSMFHDLSPGANTAASNILALLMAAYLVGKSLEDTTLDDLPYRIIFGFFQGEKYGYLGSRSFIQDVISFTCGSGMTVPSVSSDENSDLACLYPMRSNMNFQGIGTIAGMLTVDQVGVPNADGVLYVHNDGAGGMGTYLANVLKYSSTQYYQVVASAAGENANGGDYPYPPTPLQSLQSLSGGGIGGAVLSGYDYVFAKRPPYMSHLNWVQNTEMNMKAIAASATLLARAALAAAYDDGSYGYEAAAQYAKKQIEELSYQNDVLVQLAECLFWDGNCKYLNKFASMEAANERSRTGFQVGSGTSLGKPPKFYTGVYNMFNGQPFVQVGDQVYGAYNGADYGKRKTDAVGVQPKLLEQAIRNMLHDFLGRGSGNGGTSNLKSCSKLSDCSNTGYCSATGDSATCSANKVCVCVRAYYHLAKDEAIVPALNNSTGFFTFSSGDTGNSPIYTEPYWSSDVGVRMFRETNKSPGFITLAFGFVVLIVCFFMTVVVKVSMKKEKVY